MDSEYWKIVVEEEAHKIMVFFSPDGKRKWKVMLMGSLNSAPTFVSMMMKL